MKETLIFNIQRFSVHDGPGVRTTVFFKGCPLKCAWCHNPESLSLKKEIMIDTEKCVMCGDCEKSCKTKATYIEESNLKFDINSCDGCEDCLDSCYRGARSFVGKSYSVDELFKEIMKEKTMYDQSGGGVTFSGGEALIHFDFLEKIATKCREVGIHVAVDTCGYIDPQKMKKSIGFTDLFLYDIKLIDSEKHNIFTGVDNKLILDNLQMLVDEGANINLRIPLIDGVNNNNEFFTGISALVKKTGIKEINILPYHNIARGKYSKLGKDYDVEFEKPSEKNVNNLIQLLKEAGGNIVLAG